MQLKNLLGVAVVALSLTACSSLERLVYRIDVPQGNYLEAANVEQVQVGRNAQQVQYLLGTPVLMNPYSNNTWYYVYLEQHAYQQPQQYTFIVNFNNEGIVTDVNLNRPLPEVANQDENNTIIDLPDAEKKHWWQFWK